jgi:hypothetical protein
MNWREGMRGIVREVPCDAYRTVVPSIREWRGEEFGVWSEATSRLSVASGSRH